MHEAQARFDHFGQDLAIAPKPIGLTRRAPSFGNNQISTSTCVSKFNWPGRPATCIRPFANRHGRINCALSQSTEDKIPRKREGWISSDPGMN
jgi:hypothetical protein